MKTFYYLLLILTPLINYSQTQDGLSFQATTHDFGTLMKGSEAKAKFKFLNSSSKTIEILKIHGENHCLKIDTSSLKAYAPNEKGVIIAEYDTNCTGPIRKTLSVFTSLKDNTTTLKLIGEVRSE
ncbi:DUF1573 domain-containing protein [Psychroflexus tropicus]|uniref:DUF1573 domain-containing protein n=1 Tax=Psychroflexus tropicus TaxID=197345 RepID=UPI000363A391|nr:DUF1573 domain-containing protein [Psychroflexus tropicus]